MPSEAAGKGDVALNTGFSSRFHRLEDDAMGSSQHRRGFSDRYLFVGKTSGSHAQVWPVAFDYVGAGGTEYLTVSHWSYDIPLEVVFLHPLSAWNPRNTDFTEDDADWVSKAGKCGESAQNTCR